MTELPGVAVLPFQNLSENAFFAAGIHEQVISELARIPGVRVIARTSVLPYAAAPKAVRQVAEELGVDFILEGTVRGDAERVRLTAQLIDGRIDDHLWTGDYDRDLTVGALFDIQDDLAGRVADALSVALLPSTLLHIRQQPTENLAAYDLYLRGRAIHDRYDRENVDQSEAYFEAAVELDPNFGDAWAQLSRIRSWQVFTFGALDKRRSAREALDRAQDLDPNLVAYQSAARRWEDGTLMDLTQIHALLGNREEAIQILDGLVRAPTFPLPYHPPTHEQIWDPLREQPAFDSVVVIYRRRNTGQTITDLHR